MYDEEIAKVIKTLAPTKRQILVLMDRGEQLTHFTPKIPSDRDYFTYKINGIQTVHRPMVLGLLKTGLIKIDEATTKKKALSSYKFFCLTKNGREVANVLKTNTFT
jgi:hypothetical protein